MPEAAIHTATEYTDIQVSGYSGVHVLHEHNGALHGWVHTPYGIVEVHQQCHDRTHRWCIMELVLDRTLYRRSWNKYWCRKDIPGLAIQFVTDIITKNK